MIGAMGAQSLQYRGITYRIAANSVKLVIVAAGSALLSRKTSRSSPSLVSNADGQSKM